MLDVDIALIPQYYPRSKRESARLPMTCALGHLLGTYPQTLNPTHLHRRRRESGRETRRCVVKGGSKGTPRAVEAPPFTFSPALALNCRDEQSILPRQ